MRVINLQSQLADLCPSCRDQLAAKAGVSLGKSVLSYRKVELMDSALETVCERQSDK